MKNHVKRVISVLLAITLILPLFSAATVFAEEIESGDWVYTLAGDAAVITDYLGEAEDVTVPSVLDGKTVVSIADEAFKGNPFPVSITVLEGIVTIGEEAFADCPNLISVVLPDSVTGIGRRAFRYCYELVSVTLPSTLDQFPYQGFWDCQSLEEIVIPDGVSVIPNGTFNNCFSLRSAVVPDSVTTIEVNAFHACQKLENISLSAQVTTIDENAFSDCEYLVISAPEGSAAAEFALAHDLVPEPAVLESPHPYDDDGFWEYTYPGEAEALRVSFSPKCYISGAFGIDEIEVTDAEGNSYVFREDQIAGVTMVLAGNSFTVELRSYFSESDYGFRITSVEPLSHDEYEAYLADLDAHPWEAHVVNGVLEITGYRGVKGDVVIPAEINGISVVSIAPGAFKRNRIMKNVVISDGVQTIGREAFEACENLETVTLPDSVTEIGTMAFADCLALQELVFPRHLTVVSDRIAANCELLERVVLPEDLVTLERRAFYECWSLAEADLPTGVTEIGESAFAYTALEKIHIPAGVTVIPEGLCSGCDALVELVIPEGVTEIGQYAFLSCTALEEIELPSTLKSIGQLALSGPAITEIGLPEGLETIGGGAFTDTPLTSLVIPASVTSIGENPVSSCENLTLLTVDEANPAYRSQDNMVLSKDGATLLFCAGGLTGELILPEGVTQIEPSACANMDGVTDVVLPSTLTKIGHSVFSSCPSLERVDFNGCSISALSDMLFGYCTALEEIEIPAGVTEIGRTTFGYCANLKRISLPAGLETIGQGAFSYSGLEEVTIPDSVTSLDGYAFGFCFDLARVFIPDGVTQISRYAFYRNDVMAIFASQNSYAYGWAQDNYIVAIDPPRAAENLKTVGEEMTLVTPGTASKGTLLYAVTTDESAVPSESDYTETPPSATEAGTYFVHFKVVSGNKDYGVSSVIVTVAPLWGDANGDNAINNKDIVRLKRYLANLDDQTGLSTVEITPFADATGDSEVNNKDIVRLKNYLANYDERTGLSSVILGPETL